MSVEPIVGQKVNHSSRDFIKHYERFTEILDKHNEVFARAIETLQCKTKEVSFIKEMLERLQYEILYKKSLQEKNRLKKLEAPLTIKNITAISREELLKDQLKANRVFSRKDRFNVRPPWKP